MIWALAMFVTFSGLMLVGAIRARNSVKQRISKLQTEVAEREQRKKEQLAVGGYIIVDVADVATTSPGQTATTPQRYRKQPRVIVTNER